MKSTGLALGLATLIYLLLSCRTKKESTQISQDKVWLDIPISSLLIKPENLPKNFRLLKLNLALFNKKLATDTVLLPLPEIGFSLFHITESIVMSPLLSSKFPDIKTYKGTGITEKSTLRFEKRDNQFYFSILKENQTYLINPLTPSDSVNYISFNKADIDSSDRKSFELPQLKEIK